MDTPRKIVWITNLAAPYRIPVWRELGRRASLAVEILETNRRLRTDVGSNRGADWAADAKDIPLREVRTFRIARGQDRYYVTVDARDGRLVWQADAVVLGGWDAISYWQALLVAKLARTATVSFYESTLATQRNSTGPLAKARALFFRSTDVVVTPGPAAAEAVRAMGVPDERIVVGFNAINTDAFQSARMAPDAEGGHRFLYVGQLIHRKRVDALLEAFSRMAALSDTLVIVGTGDLSGELHAQAEKLGIADRVEWHEYVPNVEMPGIMERSDTLVLPSDEEVWGLVVNEALAAGLQVVVTEVCGVVPSVRSMRGIIVAEGSDALEGPLRKARDAYAGRIRVPEILQHTPEAFAATFEAAVEQACQRH